MYNNSCQEKIIEKNVHLGKKTLDKVYRNGYTTIISNTHKPYGECLVPIKGWIMKTESRTWNYAIWGKPGDKVDKKGWVVDADGERITKTVTGDVNVFETMDEAIATLGTKDALGYLNREYGIVVRGEHTPDECKKPTGEKTAARQEEKKMASGFEALLAMVPAQAAAIRMAMDRGEIGEATKLLEKALKAAAH